MNSIDNKPILTDKEHIVLRKYQQPQRLEEKDREIANKLASFSWMNLGFHEELKGGYETAKTIGEGIEIIKLSSLSRNPKALKFFNGLESVSKYI